MKEGKNAKEEEKEHRHRERRREKPEEFNYLTTEWASSSAEQEIW